MFNLMDVIVILVILISAFIGYKRGLVKTIFSLGSFFVAIGVAVLFYKPLAVILIEKTSIDEWIVDRMISAEQTSGDSIQEKEQVEVLEDGGLDNEKELSIQGALKELPERLVAVVDVNGVRELARQEFAKNAAELIMKLLSLMIIYTVVRITLIIAGFILNGVMQLPVLKQINEVLGMAIGALLGFIEMYLAFAVITFISSVTDISFVVGAIKSSFLASVMFDNNIIIRLLS